jgi:hypothetical protein
VVKYNTYLEHDNEMYKKIMDEEVFSLTKYLSEHTQFQAIAWGSSSPLVAKKLLIKYHEIADWVAKKHLVGPEVQVLLKELGYDYKGLHHE